jgi:hypothetical protein
MRSMVEGHRRVILHFRRSDYRTGATPTPPAAARGPHPGRGGVFHKP